jgi:hypothetical protein
MVRMSPHVPNVQSQSLSVVTFWETTIQEVTECLDIV